MFHVKHFNHVPRGTLLPFWALRKVLALLVPGTVTRTTSREPCAAACGDPAAMKNPPGLKYPSATGSNPTAGPTARVTTTSKAPRRSGSSWISSSARASFTETSPSRSSRHAARRKETRFLRDSTSVSAMRGSASRIGRPGIPAPAPMSAILRGRAGSSAKKRRESRKSSRTMSLAESSAVMR